MRRKACKKCGAVFDTDKRGAYLCPACSAASRLASLYRERTCIDCGASFLGYPKSKRCPSCQNAVDHKRDAAFHRNGAVRKIGSIDKCQCCGREYIVEASSQRYCKSCSPTAVRKNVLAQKRRYAAENAERVAPIKAKNRSYNKVCTICGKVFDTDTPTVTCSPECARKLRYLRQAEADYRRGRRKTLPKIKGDNEND